MRESEFMGSLYEQSMNGINMSTLLQIMKLCESVLSQKEQTSEVSNSVYFYIYY